MTPTATDTTTERAETVRGHPLNPPPLRLRDLLEVAVHISVADVNSVVECLMCHHTVPYTADVMARIIRAIICARRHTASRLLEHLAYLTSTGASPTEVLTAMSTWLYDIYEGASHS